MDKEKIIKKIKLGVRCIIQENKIFFLKEEKAQTFAENLYDRILKAFKVNQIEEVFINAEIIKDEELEVYRAIIKVTLFLKSLPPLKMETSMIIGEYELDFIHEYRTEITEE